MSIDRYTKAVLTVIAGALLYICAMLSGRPVSAQIMAPAGASLLQQTKPQPVVVVGWGSVRDDGQIFLSTVKSPTGAVQSDPTLHVRIQQPAQQPIPVTLGVTPQQPLPVALGVTPQQPLPVAVTAIKAVSDWEPVRTKAEPQPGQAMPGVPRSRDRP